MVQRSAGLAGLWTALALAACAGEAGSPGSEELALVEGSEAPAPEPSARIVLAETGWLTVSRNGTVFTTFLDPDGRYRDLQGGELAYAGAWSEIPDGKLCFAPDAGRGGCWAIGAAGDDGTARASDGEGHAILLKRITYIPPAREESPPDGPAGKAGDKPPQEG